MLIVFRFIAGCFRGGPMAIGGGVVSDLYPPGFRSRPMAWYSVGTMMGPTLGPILGGLITGGLGWRWVFWIAAILVSLYSVPKDTELNSSRPAYVFLRCGFSWKRLIKLRSFVGQMAREL
jgi:MFS family permease